MRSRVGSEDELCERLARYMQLKYPRVAYHFDFGSGTKLSMSQAVRQKRLNKRAWPDLFIAHTQGTFFGLFIELKRYGTRIKTRDGRWASEHIAEQAKTLAQLRVQGYAAEFAVGYDQAVAIIEEYLA